MRKCIVAGNWKLNNTIAQSEVLMKDIVKGIGNMADRCEVVVCPPFTAIKSVADMVANTEISVGGQDLYWQASGAFTGEVSCEMLKEAGCTYVIIGHSERRTLFHESNEDVSNKVQAAIDGGLLPIVCVGETLEQRQGKKTESHISEQVKAAFSKVIAEDVSKIVVAYEPIWAIGTGMACQRRRRKRGCLSDKKCDSRAVLKGACRRGEGTIRGKCQGLQHGPVRLTARNRRCVGRWSKPEGPRISEHNKGNDIIV